MTREYLRLMSTCAYDSIQTLFLSGRTIAATNHCSVRECCGWVAERPNAAMHVYFYRRKPHLRTPGYVHGVVGRVERHCGLFQNPSYAAYGDLETPPQRLYRVRFLQQHLWEIPYENEDSASCSDQRARDNSCGSDTVDVEIYHSWLIPATEEEFLSQSLEDRKHESLRRPPHHHHEGDDENHIHLSRYETEVRFIHIDQNIITQMMTQLKPSHVFSPSPLLPLR